MNIKYLNTRMLLLASAGLASLAAIASGNDEVKVDGDLVVIGDTEIQQGLEVQGADGGVFKGELGIGSLSAIGPGTRFMWYPKRGSLRGGQVTGEHWDDNTIWNPIGDFSFSWGRDSQSRGKFSFSHGDWSRAEKDYSVAIGFGAVASNQGAIAMGMSPLASGSGAVALGNNQAAGTGAVALGTGTKANLYSLSAGLSTEALAPGAVSLGIWTKAHGAQSTSMGLFTRAEGHRSAAFGNQTIAQGEGQFVIGRYNVPEGSSTQWLDTEDLFIVGNGESEELRSNAFTIKKNGDTTINGNLSVAGIVTVPESGDLSMGAFTAGSP